MSQQHLLKNFQKNEFTLEFQHRKMKQKCKQIIQKSFDSHTNKPIISYTIYNSRS